MDARPVDRPGDASFAELSWYAIGDGLDGDDAMARASALVDDDAIGTDTLRSLDARRERPWLAAALARAVTQLRMETGEVPRLRIGTPLATFADARLDEALAGLREIWPCGHASVGLHCERVMWLDGDRYHSMTMPYAFGAVLIRPRADMTTGELIEALLHESAHLETYVRQSYDPMVRNPLAPCRSPLRADARPVIAVLHAAHVLSRMIEGHRRWLAGPAAGVERTRSELLVERHTQAMHAAIDELSRTAVFTEAGAALFASLRDRGGRPCS